MTNQKFMNDVALKPMLEPSSQEEAQRFPIRALAEKTSAGTFILPAQKRSYWLFCPEASTHCYVTMHRHVNSRLASMIVELKPVVFNGGPDELIAVGAFQCTGGIFSESNTSVTLHAFDNHPPAYSTSQQSDTKTPSAEA